MANKEIAKRISLKDQVTPALSKINKSTIEYQKNLKTLKSVGAKTWSGIKTGMLAAGAAAIGGAVGFAAITKSTTDAADRVDKLSQKIGLSRQGFQEWEYMLSQSGTSIEVLQMGMKTLVKQVEQAAEGTGNGAKAFQRLGIQVRDTNGQIKDQETLFNETVEALQRMENGSEKAALANQLLGRSGSELMPLLNSATGSIDDMRKAARELGVVMSDEVVDAGVKLTDELDNIKRFGAAALREIGGAALPMVARGMEKFVSLAIQARESLKKAIEENRDRFNAIRETISNVRNAISGAFGEDGPATWFIQTGIPMMVGGMATVLEVATNTYDFFASNWSLIAPIVYGIVGGLAAYKAALIAVQGWKLAVTAATWAWNAALNMTPLGWISLAIGAVIAAGIYLIKNWEQVKLVGMVTWNTVVSAAEWAVNKFIDFGNFVIRIFKFAWDSVKFAGISIWNAIVSAAEKSINALLKPVNMIREALGMEAISVDFSKAKFDAEKPKWDSEMNVIPHVDFSAAQFSDDAIAVQMEKAREEKEKKKAQSEEELTYALAENTKAITMNTEVTDDNTQATNANTKARLNDSGSAMDIADSLIARLDRAVWG